MHILIAWAHINSTGESDGNLWKLRSPTIFPCILNRVFKCLNLHYHVYLLKPSKSKTEFTIFPLNIYPSEFPYCVLVIPCFAALQFSRFSSYIYSTKIYPVLILCELRYRVLWGGAVNVRVSSEVYNSVDSYLHTVFLLPISSWLSVHLCVSFLPLHLYLAIWTAIPLHHAWSIAINCLLASLKLKASIIQFPISDLFQKFSTLVVHQEPLVTLFGQFVFNTDIQEPPIEWVIQ